MRGLDSPSQGSEEPSPLELLLLNHRLYVREEFRLALELELDSCFYDFFCNH